MKFLPMIGHAAIKNSMVKPSGPDTLSFGREQSACCISEAATGQTNIAESSLEHLYVNSSFKPSTEMSSVVGSCPCKKFKNETLPLF